MSYAGPSKSARPARNPRSTRPQAANDGDWQNLAIFGTGLALGLALGAAAAMLSTPRSGSETRDLMRAQLKGLRTGWRRRIASRRHEKELRALEQI